jgi:hypothetical protein
MNRIGRRTRTATLVAVLVAAMTTAGCGDGDLPLPDGVPVCGLEGCGYVLDRETTHEWAGYLQRWDKSADVPVAAGAQLICARIPNLIAAGACVAAIAGLVSIVADQLQAADADDACLQFMLGGPRNPGSASIGENTGENCLR